jgi:hypothetical protein
MWEQSTSIHQVFEVLQLEASSQDAVRQEQESQHAQVIADVWEIIREHIFQRDRRLSSVFLHPHLAQGIRSATAFACIRSCSGNKKCGVQFGGDCTGMGFTRRDI